MPCVETDITRRTSPQRLLRYPLGQHGCFTDELEEGRVSLTGHGRVNGVADSGGDVDEHSQGPSSADDGARGVDQSEDTNFKGHQIHTSHIDAPSLLFFSSDSQEATSPSGQFTVKARSSTVLCAWISETN